MQGGGEPTAPGGGGEEGSNVRGVMSKWQTIADSNLAQKLQQDEFMDHFDKNRFERRLVGLDTKISKATQKLEDTYAAEYREQLRRDREAADAELARQMQEQMDLERQERERARRAVENRDKELALKLELSERRTKNEQEIRRLQRERAESQPRGGPGGPSVSFEEPRYLPSPATSPVLPHATPASGGVAAVAPPKPSRAHHVNAMMGLEHVNPPAPVNGVPSRPVPSPPARPAANQRLVPPDLIQISPQKKDTPPRPPPPTVGCGITHPPPGPQNHKHHLVNDLRGAKTKQLPLQPPGELAAGAYDPPWAGNGSHSPNSGSEQGQSEERPKLKDYIVQRAEKQSEHRNLPKDQVPTPPPLINCHEAARKRIPAKQAQASGRVEVPLNLRNSDPVKNPPPSRNDASPPAPAVIRPEPGMTPEQAAAIRAALAEEDARLAAELQDGEVSKAIAGGERHQEFGQNHGQRREKKGKNHGIMAGEGHLHIGGIRIRGIGKSEVASNEVNLIRFDDLSERPPEVHHHPAPERPPPKEAPIPEPSALPTESAISPSNAEAHPDQISPAAHHWPSSSVDSQSSSCSDQSIINGQQSAVVINNAGHHQSITGQSTLLTSAEHPLLPVGEEPPYLNTHARRRRDIIARGGVQVLPDVLLPK